ncbi:MAG TPA: HAD family phosphatase [Acidimicrobiia bacterium]|nr:HAD family phosphatase [Acidimicrobiia bacterium]
MKAVIFDLGGVVFGSPFEHFDEYDRIHGLPDGCVRGVIARSSVDGAWAALERGELSMPEFFATLEAEARAEGHTIDAAEIMAMVGRGIGARPEMLAAIERIREHGLKIAALTNNWPAENGSPPGLRSLHAFDVVVESAVEGMRKPDPRIYELTLERLAVDARDAVFLDDIGMNLKPARALGITTIKVDSPAQAITDLEAVLGFSLR